MSNKLITGKVRIDMDDMRRSGMARNIQSLIHQEQLNKICEIISQRLLECKNYDPNDAFIPFNDVISIFARRGAGKTTFVKTLIDLVKYGELRELGLNTTDVMCIDVIEPNQMPMKENLMVRFLASIEEKFDEVIGRSTKKKDKSLKQIKEELYEALPIIDGIGKMSMYADWDDSDYLADKYIQFAKKAKDLERRFHKYIYKILELSGRKALLFVLDDSDVNIERTFDILEIIRLFFTSPQVIVIMTGDLSLYSMAIRRHYWNFFDNEYIRKDCPFPLPKSNGRNEYFDMVHQLEAQYLQKMVKAEHRIVLNTIYDKYNRTRDNLASKQYSIRVKLSKAKSLVELRTLYGKILKEVNVVSEISSSGDYQIFVNHLLKQPFRNQYRLLSAYDEYLSTRTTTRKGLSFGTTDLAEGILKVFEVYINQSSTDGKMLMGRSPMYAGWLMKFMIDNNIATIASHLLPTIEDDTLNNALFALCIWCESQIQSDKSIAFDYLVRVSFIRQILLILGEDGKKLYDFVGICHDIDLHKILGSAHAYFNAKQTSLSNNRASKYPLAGVIKLNTPIIPSTNGIEENLVRLIQIETFSNETQTYICSFYKLIASIAELLEESEKMKFFTTKSNDWIRVKLDDISQFHSYLEPSFTSTQNQIDRSNDYERQPRISQPSLHEKEFIEDLESWTNDIESVWVTPQSLDRIFTRTFFTISAINSRHDMNMRILGEKFSSYILAFWNACVVEECIVRGKIKELELGYEIDISYIFLGNYRKFKSHFHNRVNSFAEKVIMCPLLRAYVNPIILVSIDNQQISMNDFVNIRNEKTFDNIHEAIERITSTLNELRREIGACQDNLLNWKKIANLDQRIEHLNNQIKGATIENNKVDEYLEKLRKIEQDRSNILLEQPLGEEEVNDVLNNLIRRYRSLFQQKTWIEEEERKFMTTLSLQGIGQGSSSMRKLNNAMQKFNKLSVYNRLAKWDLY